MPLSWLAEAPRIALTGRLTGLRARLLALGMLVRVRLYRAGVMLRLLWHGDADRRAAAWNRG
jgi:hypothetical protein